MMFDKLPRGVIYHSVAESLRYLAASIFMPLRNRDTVTKFENRFAEYSGRRYCVAFPFARTAIYFVLKHLNLPKGSEVLFPPITIKGIVDAVLALDLVPVYVDLDINTLSFDLDDLRRKAGPKSKAAIITPLFGLAPDMTALVDFLRSRGIFVIEDFSHCLNARFGDRRLGTFGDAGIYSSSSIKTLDTLGGGLAVTDDPAMRDALQTAREGLARPARGFLVKKAWINLVRNLATTPAIFSLIVFPLLQLMRRVNPKSTLKHTGARPKNRLKTLPRVWFSSYSSLQARIGLTLLARVAAGDEARLANATHVKARSDASRFPRTTEQSHNVYWQFMMMSEDAQKAQAVLARHGIDTATTSLELVSALEDYPNRTTAPVAERVYYNGIFLPCFPGLRKTDLDRIVAAANEAP